MKTHLILCVIGVVSLSGYAQTKLLRQPDISKDQIVFAYANDLWLVSDKGGEARRLTSFQGSESSPNFSPDGQHIAFTGQYDGNTDVYVIPVSGGEPRRLTWHPGADVVRGWTPDGKIVFSSSRESVPRGNTKLWTIGLNDGVPVSLPMTRAYRGEHSADGQYFAYEFVSPWDEEWRNYRGGQNRPIWILNMTDYALKTIPWDNSHDMQPVWVGRKVIFMSDRDLTMNIYSYDTDTDQLEQLTFYKEYDIKSLASDGERLVFEYGGGLHVLNMNTKKPETLTISVKGDFPWARPHWIKGAGWLQDASLSPSGVRALFEARGEIITIPKEKGSARNLTNTPGERDHDPAWAPDGKKIAWFSDRGGEYRLMIGDQSGLEKPREIALPSPTFFYAPVWSPDSKYIAFTDHLQQLWMTDITSGATVLVDRETYLHPERTIHPVWSPDSKWLTYSKRQANQYHAIMAYSISGKKSYMLTDALSDAVSPAWDKSGKYIYFLASTNYGPASGWLDLSSLEREVRRSVYMIVLSRDEPSPLLPESDDEVIAPEGPEAKAKEAKKKKNDAKEDEKVPVSDVIIHFDGISQRILSLSFPSRPYTSLRTGVEGELFVSEYISNADGELLHKYKMEERKADVFQDGISYYRVSHDGKSMVYRKKGKWAIASTEIKPGAEDGTLNTARVEIRVDPEQEWRQMFREAWRYQRDFLYVPNVHGADWKKVYDMYAPLVDHVKHRSDLTHLLDVLGGEVSIGHSFVRGGDNPSINPVKVGLLGADFEVANSRYRIRKIYTGENWNPELRAPLSAPGLDIHEGDYIIAVDGIELTAGGNVYSALENKVDKQVVLRVSKSPDGSNARDFVVVPIENEAQLRTFAWMEENRRKVDELSGGRLGYVWLPNTGEAGYENFNRYYFAQQDKEGMIIDERFNGGGFAADYIVDILGRKLQGYFNNVAGDRTPWTTPMTGVWGPKVMLINEMAGSGGDLLPYMFSQMEIGPLVGTRTWGGLVGIWDTPPLVDRGTITAPRGGFFNLDGEWDVENEGVAPDIEVEMTPKETIAGRDPQLEKAVEVALGMLEENPVKLAPEPAPPVRALRPNR